jgi:hypothetical protein
MVPCVSEAPPPPSSHPSVSGFAGVIADVPVALAPGRAIGTYAGASPGSVYNCANNSTLRYGSATSAHFALPLLVPRAACLLSLSEPGITAVSLELRIWQY